MASVSMDEYSDHLTEFHVIFDVSHHSLESVNATASLLMLSTFLNADYRK